MANNRLVALGIKNLIIILFIGVGVFAINTHPVFCFNDDLTHPKLTRGIAKFYNQKADIKLSQKQINWLAEGSTEEDNPFSRCVNHFYDPQTGEGLRGSVYSYLPREPAPAWANDPYFQSTWGLADRSWQKAIYNYQQDNKKEAFIALGHVIHLLEDMGVPAHVRNDGHALEDEPFEKWVFENHNNLEVDVSGANWQDCSDNRDCLISLSSYTNENFFSKDTVDFKGILPSKSGYIKKNGVILGYYNQDTNKLTVSNRKVHDKVHQSYWNHLSPKIVGYGAGLIDLFFQEVGAKDQKEPETFTVSWKNRITEGVNKAKTWALNLFNPVWQENNQAGISNQFSLNYDDSKTFEIGENNNLVIKSDDEGENQGDKTDQENKENQFQSESNPESEPEPESDPDPQPEPQPQPQPQLQPESDPKIQEKPIDETQESNQKQQSTESEPDSENKTAQTGPISPGAGAVPSSGESKPESSGEPSTSIPETSTSTSETSTSTPKTSTSTPETSTPDTSTSTPTTTLEIPSKITDLSSDSGDKRGEIDLSWSIASTTATSTKYLIRYSTSTISTSTWEKAEELENNLSPLQTGITVKNLSINTTYYFAIKLKNQAGTSTISNIASSKPNSEANYLLISEIAAEGTSGAGDEFIELYNPTDKTINLKDYSVQYASAQATSTWQNKYFKTKNGASSNLPDHKLKSNHFYLMTSATSTGDYTGAMTPDLTASTKSGKPYYLRFSSSGGKVRLLSPDKKAVDLVAWGENALGAEGEPIDVENFNWGSLERKAISSSTADLMKTKGDHHWLGNKKDFNNNKQDFVLQTKPNPQNSFSLSEPRDSFPKLADSEWPMYQENPQRTGKAESNVDADISFPTISTSTPTSTPQIATATPKWQIDLNATGLSSPVISEKGDLYIGASGGELYKIDSNQKTKELFYKTGYDRYSVNTPMVTSDGSVYFTSGKYFYALSKEGKLKWKILASDYADHPVMDKQGIIYINAYYTKAVNQNGEIIWQNKKVKQANPLAMDKENNIYFNTENAVYKLNSSTGEIVASTTRPNLLANSPISIDKKGNLYVNATGGSHGSWGLYVLNQENLEIKEDFYLYKNYYTPAVDDENKTVYLGESYGQVYALSLEGNKVVEKWRFSAGEKTRSAVVIDKSGNVYAASGDFIYCLSPEGDLNWQADLEGLINRSPAISQGGLYITTSNGKIYAF